MLDICINKSRKEVCLWPMQTVRYFASPCLLEW